MVYALMDGTGPTYADDAWVRDWNRRVRAIRSLEKKDNDMAGTHITSLTEQWLRDLVAWTGYKPSRLIEDAVKAQYVKMQQLRAQAIDKEKKAEAQDDEEENSRDADA